ncbi:MAG: acyl-CoA thioesterase [Lachnospiraceae bacterium]|nr:acyl-CoA thioesterase [Candidatus Merdinaster equi]
MNSYKHVVQYYETDKMGVTHHSNYIRWMEESRVDYLKQLGWDYVKLESLGVVSPVVEASCKYKNSTTFADEIEIVVSVSEFKGVKLVLHYEMKKADGTLAAEADSVHCFLDTTGRPIRLAKELPGFYEAIMNELN